MAKQLEESAKKAKEAAISRALNITSQESLRAESCKKNAELLETLSALEMSAGERAANKTLLLKAAAHLAESATQLKSNYAVAELEQATLSQSSSALSGKAARLLQRSTGLTGANGTGCKVGEDAASLAELHDMAQKAIDDRSAELAKLTTHIVNLLGASKGAASVDKAIVSVQREAISKLDDETNRLENECAKADSSAKAARKRRSEAIGKITASKTAVESAKVEGSSRVLGEQDMFSSEAAAATAAIDSASVAEASVAANQVSNTGAKARRESERSEFAQPMRAC
jgi:hypothetical protein